MRGFLISALVILFSAAWCHGGLKTDLLKKDARMGDVKAQYELGLAYEKGDGIKRDPAEAFGWYQKAAEQEHKEAQLALAKYYATGSGVAQSDEGAFEWAMKSARQHYGPAQFFIATCYEQGLLGQPKDLEKAAAWTKQAAQQDCAGAQYTLGTYYEQGLGVEKDFNKAVQWYLKSAEGDCVAGQLLIGRNYHRWSNCLDAKDSAKKQLVLAADYGDAESQYNLAVCYLDVAEKPALDEGITWLQASAEQSFAPARKMLADHLVQGLGVDKDPVTAEQIYLELANAGDVECQDRLGELYAGEGGFEPDVEKSAKWYLKAARSGHLNAQVRCIFIYGKGLGVEQNRAEAFAWALVAADNGKPIYKRNLEPILTMTEQQAAFKRYSSLLIEMREIRKSGGN